MINKVLKQTLKTLWTIDKPACIRLAIIAIFFKKSTSFNSRFSSNNTCDLPAIMRWSKTPQGFNYWSAIDDKVNGYKGPA